MKKTKKLCVALATILTLSTMASFVACTNDGEVEKIDETKTQLNVGNLYLGYGNDWLYAWKRAFEAKYADVCFEPGTDKKGVQVMIHDESEKYNVIPLKESFSAYEEDLYFTGDAYLYDYVGEGMCADITDMVKEDLSTKYEGETGSIEDKMKEDVRSSMEINGKYYMLPFYEVSRGINYDVDLFYEKSFFISNESTATTTKFTNDKTKFATGVDGKAGTFDDGLPATFAQFYDLLAKMKASSVTPFIWSGAHAWSYTTDFASMVWMTQDGVEQMRLNQTFNGSATTLVSSVNTASKKYNGVDYDVSTVTLNATPTTITTQNGYELQKQAGKFYALQFAKNIVNDATNFDSLSFSGNSLTHTGAQNEYLYSKYNPNKKTIAMLIDSGWWRAEAKTTFANMEIEYGEEASMENRRFGWMPIPFATSDMVGGNWVADGEVSKAFISSTCPAEKLELAKLFLQFCYTNESLRTFTSFTETLMPYDYGFANETEEKEFVNGLTLFGQNIWDLYKNGEIYRYLYGDTNDIVLDNYNYFNESWYFTTQTAKGSGDYPFLVFHEASTKQMTAKDYFEGLYTKHRTNNIWK